jgi:hypothetical protein
MSQWDSKAVYGVCVTFFMTMGVDVFSNSSNKVIYFRITSRPQTIQNFNSEDVKIENLAFEDAGLKVINEKTMFNSVFPLDELIFQHRSLKIKILGTYEEDKHSI